MIKLLGQILEQAVDYEMIERNPVRVGERSARFLPRVRRNRTFLEIDEFHALLSAADEPEAEARADRKGLGRRAMIATLGLAGFRISEMLDLRGATVDLARSRFKLPDAKTEAGVREVENSKRASSRLPELPHITPHSLRRTWATFAATIGRDPKWIAAQIGHTDPQFTFSVYRQIATCRYIDERAIWAVMRFADEPGERVTSRQLTRVHEGDPRGSPSSKRARSTSSSSASATRGYGRAASRELDRIAP
jgi:integrase